MGDIVRKQLRKIDKKIDKLDFGDERQIFTRKRVEIIINYTNDKNVDKALTEINYLNSDINNTLIHHSLKSIHRNYLKLIF